MRYRSDATNRGDAGHAGHASASERPVPIFRFIKRTIHCGYISPVMYNEINVYEDAVIIETTARAEADCNVTRNGRDYADTPLSVFTPTEFVDDLDAEAECFICYSVNALDREMHS